MFQSAALLKQSVYAMHIVSTTFCTEFASNRARWLGGQSYFILCYEVVFSTAAPQHKDDVN